MPNFDKHLDIFNVFPFSDYSTIHKTSSWKERDNKPSSSTLKSTANPGKPLNTIGQIMKTNYIKKLSS